MKYQEQINGMTQNILAQAPQNVKDPRVVEQVMAQAAQQVMMANQAMAQQGGTPEQQRDRRNPNWKKSLEEFEKRRQRTKLIYYN